MVIKTPTGTVDIGLFRDEVNEAAPHRGPRVKVQSLGYNLTNIVEQAQEANLSTLEPKGTTLVKYIPCTSTTPTTSRSTSSAALVSIATVKKLEAHMATLLHHIHPWMQNSIAEVEEKIEKKISQ